MRYMGPGGFGLLLCWIALQTSGAPAADSGDLKVRLSWGHRSPSARPYYVKLVPADSAIQVLNASGDSLEPGDGFKEGAWQTTAGQGDVDGVTLTLRYSSKSSTRIQNLHIIWADLIAQSDAETARRLSQDAAFHPGCPKLEVQLNVIEFPRVRRINTEQPSRNQKASPQRRGARGGKSLAACKGFSA
ncbi:MAG: hypothetical protein DMG09_08300 [Acidobacteria bacterium]|nr:MAG: hypothetical protein DMG09_08300 [Acidobacteriota bacterium]